MSAFGQRDLFKGYADYDSFATAVSLGYIGGWETFRKFGMNPDVDAGTEQVWPPGTIVVLPTSAAVASLVSTSVNDDLAGTGAQKVWVEGLDDNYNFLRELVDMDGTVASTSIALFFRIFRAYVDDSGALDSNDGDISISVGGDLQALIESNEGQTHVTHYTVPANHALVLDYYAVNGGKQAASEMSAQFQIKLDGKSWRSLSDVFPYEGLYAISQPRIVVPAKTEVRILVVYTGTNGAISAEYSGFLVDISRLPAGHTL